MGGGGGSLCTRHAPVRGSGSVHIEMADGSSIQPCQGVPYAVFKKQVLPLITQIAQAGSALQAAQHDAVSFPVGLGMPRISLPRWLKPGVGTQDTLWCRGLVGSGIIARVYTAETLSPGRRVCGSCGMSFKRPTKAVLQPSHESEHWSVPSLGLIWPKEKFSPMKDSVPQFEPQNVVGIPSAASAAAGIQNIPLNGCSQAAEFFVSSWSETAPAGGGAGGRLHT